MSGRTIRSPQGQRIEPALPVGAVKTYGILAPRSTHWRPSTCAEVECPAWRSGWRTLVQVTTELGAQQAYYIRMHSGRAFTAGDPDADGMVTFVFPPGQQCFAEHPKRLEREEIYVVRDGDWRGNPRGTAPTRHKRAADWVDDFANHQDRLATRYGQG